MKLLICENPKTIEINLKPRLEDLGFNVVDYVASPRKALDILESERVDLVIMDTFSDKEFTGFDAATIIREKFKIPVLFLTAEDNLSNVQSLSGESIMLVKPVKDIELKVNIPFAVDCFNAKTVSSVEGGNAFNEYIFVRADYKLNKIRVLDIYYIEAKKDYVNIHTSDNVYTVHSTMRDIMNVLPDNKFIRIHRSYIVNIDKIFSIKYPDLLVENKMKVLPVGGLYRKELFDKLNII